MKVSLIQVRALCLLAGGHVHGGRMPEPNRFRRVLLALAMPLLLILAEAEAQEWVRMSGITDQFTEMKSLAGTDTFLVTTQSSGMYMSPDGGTTWDEIPAPVGSSPPSLEAFRRGNAVEIIVSGYTPPYLYRSTDFGQSWQPAAANPPRASGCRLQFDRTGRLWAYRENRIFFSDDSAAHWDSLAGPSGAYLIWDLWVSPYDSSVIWAAAGTTGAFASTDRGATWQVHWTGGDVGAIEGNPLNDRSTLISVEYQGSLWNHGDGQWQDLDVPIVGQWADAVFLDGDSTQLLAIGGLDQYARNIYRSTNSGQTWAPVTSGFVSLSGWRICLLGDARVAVLLSSGAIIGDALAENCEYARAGVLCKHYLISRLQPQLIWAQSQRALYVSSDAGQTWRTTPFIGASVIAIEHADRTAIYVDVGRTREFYCLSSPSLDVDTLVPPPLPFSWVYATTPADTSLIYAVGDFDLAVSRDGGQSWVTRPLPSPASTVCLIHPSSTVPEFAFLTVSYWNLAPFQLWRTTDYGQEWTELSVAYRPGSDAINWAAWAQGDALVDFNCLVFFDPLGEYWYYYTTNGGDSFDSLCIWNQVDGGFLVERWGDSTMAYRDAQDSVFITPDRCRTLQYRLNGNPEGTSDQYRFYDGRFGQLIAKYWDDKRAYYYGPLAGIGPSHDDETRPGYISLVVYPNPTNSAAYLWSAGGDLVDPIRVRIFNILGQQVMELTAGSLYPIPLPLHCLSTGMYFITASDRTDRVSAPVKLVVTK